jgi:hypothetical protein
MCRCAKKNKKHETPVNYPAVRLHRLLHRVAQTCIAFRGLYHGALATMAKVQLSFQQPLRYVFAREGSNWSFANP